MALTQRDLEILALLARFRFLSSRQTVRLVGGSHQQVLRRLRRLFDHSMVDRPRAQIADLAHVYDVGNRPLVYGLAAAGSRVLAESGFDGIDRLDWTTKNARAGLHFLAHTLETAEVMIGFEMACRETGVARLVDHHQLLPWLPEATRASDDPFRLDTKVKLPRQSEPLDIAVIPDRVFSLALPNATRLNFALEMDRGTMDIRSKQLVGKSSFRRKLLGYWQAWRDGAHTERWGFKSFRVLTVTTSEARIKTMLEVQREIVGPQGSNVFAFTTREQLSEYSPLADAWVSGKGEKVQLLPSVE
jgi:hypothetical protein